jgi:hypothetical protein
MSWYVIETLERESMSIVFKDGNRRNWTQLRTLQREAGVGRGELGAILGEVRRTGQSVNPRTIDGYQGSKLITAFAILSHDKEVYGIQLWIGDVDEEILQPRRAAAIRWDTRDLQINQGLESWLMSSNDPDGFRRKRNPGEFLRKVVRYDAVDELTEHAINPVSGRTIEHDLVVLHDEGHLMKWFNVVRDRNDDDHVGLRGLIHDVTDTHEPQVGALEHVGVTEINSSGPVSALIAFPNDSDAVIVVKFLTKPPEWIDYQLDGSNDVLHPEDWSLLRRNQQILSDATPGARVKSEVRVRTPNPQQWVSVNLVEWRYPGAVGDKLHIVQLSRQSQGQQVVDGS